MITQQRRRSPFALKTVKGLFDAETQRRRENLDLSLCWVSLRLCTHARAWVPAASKKTVTAFSNLLETVSRYRYGAVTIKASVAQAAVETCCA
jgi:hypothetical protein